MIYVWVTLIAAGVNIALTGALAFVAVRGLRRQLGPLLGILKPPRPAQGSVPPFTTTQGAVTTAHYDRLKATDAAG